MIKWARRVKLWQIYRFYHLYALGIVDSQLLEEIGWGFYARAQDVITVVNAVKKGKVPCPNCGHTVLRAKHEWYMHRERARAGQPKQTCSGCKEAASWQTIRDSLRTKPRCFTCGSLTKWRFAGNEVFCTACQRTWSWQQYRKSVGYRKWLPCPACGRRVRKQEQTSVSHRGHTKLQWERMDRSSRLHERLRCERCEHGFSWRWWKDQYKNENLLVGNVEVFEDFVRQWPTLREAQSQVSAIDSLLHAIHARGSLSPALVDSCEARVKRTLDQIAGC